MHKKSLALVLGGGGARGLAHIGVIKVLFKAGLKIDFLAGTSIGGIMASALASGKPIEEIEDFALHHCHYREMVKIIDLTTRRRGLLHGEKVRKMFSGWLGENLKFEDLAIPLVMNAVNLATGKEVTLNRGPLMPALFSTFCVPGFFSPVFLDGQCLVDGGVLNNLPVSLVKPYHPDVIIAVDVHLDPGNEPHWRHNSYKPHWPVPTPDFFMDFYRSMLIMMTAQTEQQLSIHPPDFLIRPPVDSDISMFMGFPRAAEIIAAGELAAQTILVDIQNKLGV